jgi:hypothetical protein
LRSDQCVTLRLNRLDLFEHEFEPIQLTAELSFQISGQFAPVTSPELFEPCPPIPTHGLIIRDPLREQEALDAVDMTDPFDS